MKNYYKILEVDRNASKEVINAAYKVLAKKYHPDLQNGIEVRIKQEKMKELNEAKDILFDANKRQIFDYELSKEEDELINEIALVKRPEKKLKESIITKENIKKLLFIFTFVAAFIQLILVLNYSVLNKSIENNFELKTGITKQQVIDELGAPDNETSAFLQYDDAKIFIKENEVIGWNDIYEDLPFKRNFKIPTTSLPIGSTKEDILATYGTPDVFEDNGNILTYYNIILYFKHDELIKIEEIQK